MTTRPYRSPAWTAGEEQILRDAVARGVQLHELPALLTDPVRTYAAIAKHLSVIGVRYSQKPKPLTSEESAVLISLWGKGVDGVAIGQRLGRDRRYIYGQARKLGLVSRRGQVKAVKHIETAKAPVCCAVPPSVPVVKIDHTAEIARLHKSGRTITEIGALLRVPYSFISDVIAGGQS